MNILNRFVERYRNIDRGRYVCTLCGATFENQPPIICPKCRGLVTEREA